MNIIFKKPKTYMTLIIIIILLIGVIFKIESILFPFFILIVIAMYVFYTKEALKNLMDCIFYLLLIAPIISLGATAYIAENHILKDDLLIASVGLGIYFSIWLFIVIFGEIKTVKLATLIIAQLATVLFLIVNMIVNFVPVNEFSNAFSNITETDLIFLRDSLGFTLKEFTTIMLQLLLYPSLITALLTYIISEIRVYLIEKKLEF